MAKIVTFLLLAALSGTAMAQSDGRQNCAAVSSQTCSLAHSLRRGVNLGNMLDAPREGDWGVRVEDRYIDLIAQSFATVRIPARWSNHAAPTADATLDETFARRVDGIVDAFLAKGLHVILDIHHYSQLTGDALQPNEFAVEPAVVEQRFLNIWRQLAARYRYRSPKLVLELLNEPHGRLTVDAWNQLAAQALAVVRSVDSQRTVLIGLASWNAIPDLPKLRLPADRNLIVAVHNYDPFPFTHQGASFLPKPYPVGTPCCDAGQQAAIIGALDQAQRWNAASGYPLHLGEFGSHSKAPMDSRVAYTRLVRDEAEKRGFGWTYWEFASSFGVFSPAAGTWVEPIRKALLD